MLGFGKEVLCSEAPNYSHSAPRCLQVVLKGENKSHD